ncbi:MAG: hypothetical protein M5R36_12280 [Deltaproteobacteria bacterium]|nr:hypothetical protein [Deltaproteobacteria bacterium]
MLWPTLDWEGDFVGAPTVLHEDGKFRMWYEAGAGAAIGYAESGDGLTWTKNDEPMMLPDQDWEEGVVAAPAVIRHGGLYRMYYSGGRNDDTTMSAPWGYAIGYADSEDGRTWTKRDVAGRASGGDEAVEPILRPSDAWEGTDEEKGERGAVTSPSVLIYKPADRDLTLMYYTGGSWGDPVERQTSIGVAAVNDDYNDFHKGPPGEINPIVNQKFDLRLYGISQYLAYSESGPSVVRVRWNQFLMIYAQTDPLSETGTDGRGLAIASCPPRN